MDVPDTLPAGQYVIYALIDPDDHLIYYVGQTRRPKARLAWHLFKWPLRSTKASWMESLKERGKHPLMEGLEIVTSREEALAREQVWIKLMLQQGMPLVHANSKTSAMYLKEAIQPVRQERGNICGCAVWRVWLPDGRTAIIIRELAQYLGTNRWGQSHQIRSDPVLSPYLVYVQIAKQTGRSQIAAALVEGILPLWLVGLQLTGLSAEKRALVDEYLREVAEMLCRQPMYSQTSSRVPDVHSGLTVWVGRAIAKKFHSTAPAPEQPEAPAPLLRPTPEEPGAAQRSAWQRLYAALDETQQALVALREEEQAERARLEQRLLEQEQRVADLKEWFTSLDRQVAILGQRQQEPTLSATHLSDLEAILCDLEQATRRTPAQMEAELTTLFKVEAITAIPDAFWPEVLAWYAWSATRS